MNVALKVKIIERFATQADFAMRLGVDDAVVSRVVRGRRQLPKDQQKRWAAALKCKTSEIFNQE